MATQITQTNKYVDGRTTLVLTLDELYRVNGDTLALAETNFKDLSHLLKTLIKEIERSGQWEFVQYIANKPSLFIIREVNKRIGSPESVKYDKFEPEVEIKNHYEADNTSNKWGEKIEEPAVEEVVTNKEFKNTEKVVQKLDSNVFISELPWEKK